MTAMVATVLIVAAAASDCDVAASRISEARGNGYLATLVAASVGGHAFARR